MSVIHNTYAMYIRTRDSDYLQSICGQNILPLTIATPLRNESFQNMIKAARKALGNNFLSLFLTTVGSIIAFHREYILQLQDEFPIFLCYSEQTGTGKRLSYSVH